MPDDELAQLLEGVAREGQLDGSGGGLAQLQVSRIASTSFRVIRPVLFEVLKTS